MNPTLKKKLEEVKPLLVKIETLLGREISQLVNASEEFNHNDKSALKLEVIQIRVSKLLEKL